MLVQAVRADLARWGIRADSIFAAAALDLAARLDAVDVRPAAAAQLHGQLRETAVQLVKLAPAEQTPDDALDELTKRRNERRGA